MWCVWNGIRTPFPAMAQDHLRCHARGISQAMTELGQSHDARVLGSVRPSEVMAGRQAGRQAGSQAGRAGRQAGRQAGR